jgi:coenzyme F420 hydrogenase subunit beta
MSSRYLQAIQENLTPQQRLSQIVEHSMCIGCGICQSVAGPDSISMEIVGNGCFRPVASEKLSHEVMDRVLDICPGTRVEGLPREEVTAESRFDVVWGDYRDIYYAWAAEPEVRHMAATGGLLTGLALYLIESGTVDFIVHATEPVEHPTFGERFISRSREQVLQGSGSRYGPTATLIDIVEIIDKAELEDEKFAFVGTPCDVSALRNYARHDERVSRYCCYMLTMVCGGFMEAEAATAALKKFDVDYNDVVSLRYRGYGCPGATTIKTTDGRTVQMNYLDYWGEDESTWGLPPRCKICPDGIGDAADIAAADTWDGGAPPWLGQDEDPGFNAAIVRTQRGVALMNSAIEAGYLSRGDGMTPEDMNRVQPHQENKKRAVWARLQGLKNAGQVIPDTHGLRLKKLYDENDPGHNQQQQQGAEERARQGRFSEATPVKASVEV